MLIFQLQGLGQWLCVPPFQVVCLLRVLSFYVKNIIVPPLSHENTKDYNRYPMSFKSLRLWFFTSTPMLLFMCLSALVAEQLYKQKSCKNHANPDIVE